MIPYLIKAKKPLEIWRRYYLASFYGIFFPGFTIEDKSPSHNY